MFDSPREMLVSLKVVEPPSIAARMTDDEVEVMWKLHKQREIAILEATVEVLKQRHPSKPMDELLAKYGDAAIQKAMQLIRGWKAGTGQRQTPFWIAAKRYHDITDEMARLHSQTVDRIQATNNVVPFNQPPTN